MMINYNPGFILKLGIDEKQRLKETIDQIMLKSDLQKKNEERKESEHRSHIFMSDLMYGLKQKQNWPNKKGEGTQKRKP